jgi:hypothetical protein
MMEGLLLPVVISSIRSLKDGSVSVCVETQELSPAKAGELFSLRKKVAMMYLSPKDVITQKEMDQVNAITADLPQGKTPSKRMYNVLYILWKQDPEGYKDFQLYYMAKMEDYIENLKLNIKD